MMDSHNSHIHYSTYSYGNTANCAIDCCFARSHRGEKAKNNGTLRD